MEKSSMTNKCFHMLPENDISISLETTKIIIVVKKEYLNICKRIFIISQRLLYPYENGISSQKNE